MAGRRENLTHKLTVEEQRAGGVASGKARAEKANLRKCLEALLEKDVVGSHGETMTGAEAMAVKLFQSALKGDVRAWEVLRDTAGQKPVDKVESTNKVVDLSNFTTEQIKEMLDDEI